MVARGQVRREDLEENEAADIDADLGWLRPSEAAIQARNDFLRVKGDWYPFIVTLHKLMVAISREVLNIDDHGGTSVHPVVWDQGSRVKTRRADTRVIIEFASQPGPPRISGQRLALH